MIFTAFSGGEGSRLSELIGFGGRSFADAKQNKTDALFGNAFNKHFFENTDNSRYKAISLALDEIGLSADNISDSMMKTAETTNKAIVGVKGFGLSAKAASIGAKALAMAGNMLVSAIASLAITYAMKGIEYIVNYSDHMAENLASTKAKIEENESTIASLNDELEKTQKHMSDLKKLGMGNWTPVQREEYDLLKQQNDELERRLVVEQALLRINQRQKGIDYEKAFTSFISSSGTVDDTVNLNEIENQLLTDAAKYGVNDAFAQELANKYLFITGTSGGVLGREGTYTTLGLFEIDKRHYNDNLEYIKEYRQKIFDADEEIKKLQKADPTGVDSDIQAEIAKLENNIVFYDENISKLEKRNTELLTGMSEIVKEANTAADGISYVEGEHLTAQEKAINNYLDTTNYMNEALADLEIDARALSNFEAVFESEAFSDQADQLTKLAEAGELTAETLSKPQFEDMMAEWEKLGWTAEQVAEQINDSLGAITQTKPQLPDFSTTLSSLYKNTEKYTTLTDAIEEQASAGKISVETMKALTDISPDFINYLEKTADGYTINTDALMKYIEAQDLMEKTKAINAIHDLNEELKDADITSDRRDQILAEIQKWEMLVYEIENATGALAKYKAASETENQDADFAVGKSIYELIKENRKIGKTGTDDFQAGVEFLLGEGWEERYANDLKAAYKEAEEIGKKFFGQETESDNYKNFFNYLAKETDFARFNELGQVVFDNVDLAAIAEEIGMSVDAVRSLFQLAEAYGNKIEYDFEVDATELEYAEAVINELEERRKTAQAELNKSKVGTEAYNRWSSQVNELDKMIDIAGRHAADMESDVALTIDGAIEKVAELGQYSKYLTEHGFEVPVSVTGDINALNGFLNNFELAKDDKGNTIGYTIEVENAEKASELIENLKGQMEEVQNNTDISDTMRATLTEQMQATVDSLQAYVDSGAKEAFTFALSIDENSAKLVDTLMVKDPDAIVLTIEVEPNAYQLAQEQINKLIEDKTLKIIPEVEDTGDVISASSHVESGEKLGYTSTYENGNEEYHDSVTNERLARLMVAGTDNIAIKDKDGSYFAENIQSYFERIADEMYQLNGKIPSVDQLTTAYEGALERGEITVANLDPDKLKEYAENGTYSIHDKLYSKTKAPVDVDFSFNRNDAEKQVEDFIDDVEGTEIDLGINIDQGFEGSDLDYLDESVDYILHVADAYGAAESSQNAMKQSTDELKAALANLAVADQGDALSWQAASEQLNSAVTNYQSAYNTLASELEELVPVDVKANISSAKKSIESLNGKTVTVNVKANSTSTSTSSGGGLLSTIKGWFSGSSNAYGTTNAKKGMSLVDEEGPELIEHVSEGTYELGTNKGPRFTKLNEGDIVHTAGETKKILTRMGGAIGGFFRDGLNNTKAIIGRAFRHVETVDGAAVNSTKKTFLDVIKEKVVDPVVNTVKGWSESASGAVDTKPTSTSSSKGSGSGSGSSSKSGKLDDYLSKLFDWIEVRLTRLQQSTDGWLAQVAEAVGYVAKNAKLDNALTSVAKQIDASTKAYSRYMQQAQEIADKFNLDPELIRLVQEGEIDIASYDEDTQKKINAYKEYYDKAVDAKMAVSDLVAQEKELATQKLDNISDHFQWRVDRYDATISKRATDIDLKRATGQRVTKDDYTDAMMATASKIVELQKSRDTLQAEFNSMVEKGYIAEGTEEWYEYTSRLEEADEAIVQTRIDLSELQDEVHNVDLTNLQYALADIERAADKIHQSMSLHEAQGREHTADDYLGLIKNGFSYINNLRDQNRELEMQQQLLDPLSEKYQELQEQIDSNNQSISDMMVSQEQWNDSVVDLKIGELQKYRDELSKTNADYQSQLQIQQSLEELEKAKSQRTVRVFREGQGFVYERDEDAVRDAQNNFDQLLNEQLLAKIDDVIEAIGKSKADTNVYDANGVLLGEQYTLPSLDDLSSFLVGTSGENIVNKSMDDVKKAVLAQVLGGATTTQNMPSFQIGDIVVQGVDNANALAEAIIDEFPNALLQALNSKV